MHGRAPVCVDQWREVRSNRMDIFISSLAVLAGLLAIPVAIFFLEVTAAIALPHRDPTPAEK